MKELVAWLGLGVIAALIVAVLALYADGLKADLAAANTRIEQQARIAAESARAQSERYRTLEQEHHDKIAEIEHAAAKKLAAARADAARARAVGGRLRHAIDQLAAASTPAQDCTATGSCTPIPDPIHLLADLQRRADERAGELAAIADDARQRGLACERAYDSARALTGAAGETQPERTKP